MTVNPKQLQALDNTKIIGFRVTEDELQNTIYPVMHDCYQLDIIHHDTLTSFLRFCVQFWMDHYRMKKQQFDMSHQEIEQEEKKKLQAILAEKEAWHKWDNSTPRVIEKATKELSRQWERSSRGIQRGIYSNNSGNHNSRNQKQNNSHRPHSITYHWRI
jgi:hypothetical protein